MARSFLASCSVPADEEAVLLVVTELVSNAVQHGEDPIRLQMTVSEGSVHVDVEDGGSRAPIVGSPRSYDASGRGLSIVARLGRWGCAPLDGNGKRVWCDIDAAGSP